MLHQLLAFIIAAFAGFSPAHAVSYAAPNVIPPVPEPQATVLFAGDMMFDRTIRTTIEQKGGDFIFSCIDSTLAGQDLVVANLEGPITATSSRSVGSAIGSEENFVFTFPLSTAALLASHRIGVVNLGNNHVTNFGEDGVRSTIRALTDAGVGYFGDPLSQAVAAREVRGVHLAFINYNEFEPSSTASTTVAQIGEARARGDVAIVYAHWGIEYATTSAPYMHVLAHEFADAGAALVVGSHPHVVQEHEAYHGAYIYYSLGNFIFDQYWSDAVRHGLVLQVTFTPQGLQSIKEIPVELEHDRRTCPVE
jgi:poly-gamma-glutamate synthesis protein (capsule biosynthesis protein)